MVRYLFVASALALSAQKALAVAEWGQCGGLNWTGSTTCDTGLTCVYQNDWYYQCLRVSSSTTASSTSKTSSSSKSSSTSSTRVSSSTSSSKSSTITSSSNTSSTSASSSTKAPSGSVSSCAAAQTYTGTLPVYPQQPTGLSTLMKPHGRYVGISYDGSSTYITDTAYTDIVFGNAAQLTPENSFKWGSIEVTEGDFDSNALWADRMAELAPANCLTLRGHTLIWHQQLPTWITSGSWTNATLQAAIVEHVTGEMTKFKGQIHTWDVVNEVIGDDANMRASIFYTTIGETYIDLAFKTAKSVDTVPILAINDYNIESASSKSTAMVNLVTRLKSRGAPVEQVGIQGHLIVGSVSSAMATQWNAYTALGVSVAVTELDIRMTLPATDALLAQQANDYVAVFTACLAVSACKGVTLWGASDKYSWVPASFSGQGSACLWDENYAAKPAYTAVQNYLASA